MGNFQQAIEKLEFETVCQRIIRYASSDPGRDFLKEVTISTSLQEIELMHSNLSELKKLLEEEDGLPLEGIYGVNKSLQLSSIEGTVLSAKDLSQILSTLAAARAVKQFISKRKVQCDTIALIAENLYTDKVIEFNINQAIDEAGNVREDASAELRSIRRSISEKSEYTKKRLEGILRGLSSQGFTQDEIITTREGRFVIPVKAEHKNHVQGFIHSASGSGVTVFIEPSETLELNNELRSLQFQEQREIERILRALTNQVRERYQELQANGRILAELDALNSKAKYAIEVHGIVPELRTSGSSKLVEARHPILLQTHGHKGTVPLDIELGEAFNTLIISGPNAGGKSVAMKTVGLLSLMSQSGLHIPASDGSVLRIFENIFVDIGDEQSIENDLSTFSSHLRNLKIIDEQADDTSLVLIDEIGSGTDPVEGGGIAAALLESLSERGTCTIATTHQSALKVFAHDTKGITNGAMEFDQDNLSPTFRFRAGIPGSSFALEMAQRLGFRELILDRSRTLMGNQQAKLEQLTSDLERSAQQYLLELEGVRNEKTKLDTLVGEYESRISNLATELKDLKRKAVHEAHSIVVEANAIVERSIREIKESGAERNVVKRVREEIAKSKEDLESKQPEAPVGHLTSGQSLDVGSFVKLAGGVESGEIFGIDPDARTAIVLFGNLKMRVALKDLILTKKKTTTRHHLSSVELEKAGDILRDIDLRGMTSDEAIPLVDKFLDTAMLAGLHRIDIIHGKGTGALRKKVTDFLSKHPHVKSYRLGEWNEGGTGATVVELTE